MGGLIVDESRLENVISNELVRCGSVDTSRHQYSPIVTAMFKRHRHSDASVVSVSVEAPPTPLEPAPGTSLMELPTELLGDVARRAFLLGAGETLSLTCRALANTNLSHAPSLHIQLDSQDCNQFLSGRSQFQLLTPVDAVLRARTCKLALTLEAQQDQHTGRYFSLVTNVLKKLGSCAALEACKLGTIQSPSRKQLGCIPKHAQRLLDSFPSLTSLSLHGYEIPCSGLASLLSKSQLSLQLQQLDLTGTTILKPKRPEPGAATLDNLFHASKLKQLRLSIQWVAGEDGPRMPNLQPMSQHLTHVCLTIQRTNGLPENVIAALQLLAQLQVLTLPYADGLVGLLRLLQAWPRLHTLQLPNARVEGQGELNALLEATQLTSIKLQSVEGLTSSRADATCSWQRLEFTRFGLYNPSRSIATAAYLPLHSLTQPLVLQQLVIRACYDDRALVAAAVHNLTQTCKVPVRIKELWLSMSNVAANREQVEMQSLVAELQALKHCSRGRVCVSSMNVGAEDVSVLAPLCQDCTHFQLYGGSVTPSLEFWRQLVQLMPTATDVVLENVEGSTSSAMHESLQLMADQPWSRWLDICIIRPPGSPELPACWLADNPSKPGKLRVWFKHEC
ncbi:hypothetical protein QJQ45_010946 [Haematococcus lacustris]|nr:hypothetical protein QJQ45_010946 [Haematococcus lacustris]